MGVNTWEQFFEVGGGGVGLLVEYFLPMPTLAKNSRSGEWVFFFFAGVPKNIQCNPIITISYVTV